MGIGIDVGGTNTDAVLMDGNTVAGWVKAATTADVSSGIHAALAELVAVTSHDPAAVTRVMIGTTHFINSLVQARGLSPTACIRLGLPATSALPPMTAWPADVRQALNGQAYLVHGGNEFDGRRIADLQPSEIAAACEDLAEKGIRSLAISSVFSPISAGFELEAEAIAREVLGPGFHISLSHRIGRIGLLERENAAIINAALREMAVGVVSGLVDAVTDAGIDGAIYLSQNDGTLIDLDTAREYPVATFASGPTNSMRGAAILSGLSDCAVIDVGGTTSDIGVLGGGFPRVATTDVEVAGIRPNFRMPDVLSLGIGGGSHIADGGASVGPLSVGYLLPHRALVFGGDTLTATDVAVAAGRADVGDGSLVAHLDRSMVAAALETIARRVAETADRMPTSSEPIPVLGVGGGSILLPDELPGFGSMIRPEHFSVANAVGASIAQVAGEIDRVFVIQGSRGDVIEAAKQEALDKAVAAGAEPGSVQLIEFDEVPIPYLPGDNVRIRAKAVGDLAAVPGEIV
ncbi:hydantoinase/oxoprolinase family protein [Microbacterium paludicola]|uniref:Hydantoinase/oxoprolinase family protein n=1 Tax=Microbacterium paludicola TaxID=300019 RepID=A0A4Y9FUW4_9MICO|nr:hydantoinase/oxoprolinase family protein [Microbacterium paludicola]MBF0816583.1 hydantoinase/oxoprolinase family protein [Microbacterium paludicola]TFU32783.1 hydantoinase/oxoprolinase family protein [Microbacterium paludicola]